MYAFLFSSFGFIAWSLTIILLYYSRFYSNIDHIESTSGFLWYIVTIGIIYTGYKLTTILLWWKKLSFNFWSILGIVFFHILILSFTYSSFPEIRQSPFMQWSWANWLTLFIHICTLLIYPLFLILITRSLGFSIAHILLNTWKDIDIRLRIPAEITLWFIVFVTGLILIWSLWFYTLPGLTLVLILVTLWGYTWHKETYKDIQNRSIEIENHDFDHWFKRILNLKLLSIEFWFFFLIFLLGVALINIIRPMPIGWDDLGVYMNFPKIMAASGHLLEGGSMYAWQLITGTGFLFSYNAAQAFYVNQLGWILAVIAIISTLSYAFEQKGKKSLLSLPILFAAVYYAMPMTVFQQAKDMKLDPAYLFFSISGLMLLFHTWRSELHEKRYNYSIIGIIGLIIWFSFTVKFTSIMLILACLGVIAYRLLSFSGYIWFFFLFLATFTKMQLWGMMNVPMAKDDPGLINSLSLILSGVWLAFLIYSLWSSKKEWLKTHLLSSWIISSIIFLFGVIITCSPWLIKNASEIGMIWLRQNPINLLNWSGWTTIYPYEWLFTDKELSDKKKLQSETMTTNGQSQNEDLWRYFWYENGLNNYLKLPVNLTFQRNQWWEFTDITYIFLALLPGLLLFVRGRRTYTMLAWIGVLLFFMVYYYFGKGSWAYLSKFFWEFSLIIEPNNWKSYGYAVLLIINFTIVGYFHFATKDTEENHKLREVIVFMGVYAFLFIIAAFWIVWYGIVMYFWFFLIMGYSALTFLSDEEDTDETKDRGTLHLTLATILFIFIATYFLRSAFPHGWNNLKSAYYNEYKYNTLSQEESIFAYRSDYLVPIATMNLKSIPKIFDGIETKMKSKQMKEFLEKTDIRNLPLDTLHASFIMKYRNVSDIAFREDIRTLGQYVYSQVLYPPKDNQNTGWIYRIGTFMTYLINENRKRYLDDSLLMTFSDYLYDPSPEKTIDRMKSLGLRYLLVDLNAATIDRDPRHALTDRAEKLLVTMNASNLRLVNTDNFCIELAISERKKWKLLTDTEFLDIAGTNYESYRDGVTIYRNQKLGNCHTYIIWIINSKRASEYPVIEAIQREIMTENASQDTKKLQSILSKYAGQSWFALFEIIDTPPLRTEINTGTTLSWWTLRK